MSKKYLGEAMKRKTERHLNYLLEDTDTCVNGHWIPSMFSSHYHRCRDTDTGWKIAEDLLILATEVFNEAPE